MKQLNKIHIFFLFSGLLGLSLGALRAHWQEAVVWGQVVGGIVNYPLDSPLNSMRTAWTLIHQIVVVLLQLGVDEAWSSVIISAICSFLFYQGFALILFAFCRNGFISLFAALLLVVVDQFPEHPDYPIVYFGSHTYSIIATGLGVEILGLISVGWYRGAAFLLGISPAFHSVWGAWFWALGGSMALFYAKFSKEKIRLPKKLSGKSLLTVVKW